MYCNQTTQQYSSKNSSHIQYTKIQNWNGRIQQISLSHYVGTKFIEESDFNDAGDRELPPQKVIYSSEQLIKQIPPASPMAIQHTRL